MEFSLSVSALPGSDPFALWIEPEGMYYEFPAAAKVVLTFRGADAMTAELSHRPDAIVVWRPADTEVWATGDDGDCYQIAGWADNPAPGLDTAGAPTSLPARELIESIFHPRPPESGQDAGK
ncbi:hypothetical protein Cs7R123_50600 [Catellatospora sp. TT07R-123]|uniref:hypothetical protein n=1 Tax=Catellatospora sp. TT07R-123 TaxID=2733863 RepID=UPI001B24DF49|nr:hypothetical protein [Catellatospora sp. TT07R-123]GHJ47718.1 hypothetical protein Cs7R123_50600 [Catellatospora sp. TT07R-123]